ncbi:hypothetical protein Tco_0417228 [Tanacetum coccineum]
MDNIDLWDIRRCWGKFSFEYDYSEAVGMSGGILCIWDDTIFQKKNRIVSDNFVIVSGVWIPSGKNLLVISVYAPQDLRDKKLLWDYLCSQDMLWEGDVYLSDHRPILMRESDQDYGPTPFKFYHYGSSILLKFMKERIKFWIKSYKESVNGQKNTLKRELQQLDSVIDKGCGGANEVQCMQDVVGKIRELEKIEIMEMAQKANIKWAVEGDENPIYITGCCFFFA